MYKSFFILINDYFLSVRKNVIFDIILPFIIACISGFLLSHDFLYLDQTFLSNVLSVLGIIAGFSVTAITMLTTSDSDNIMRLKSKKTNIVIDGLEINVFRRFYILISYSVLISFIAILINTIGYLVPWSKIISNGWVIVLKSLNLWLILHIFFINIRNITSLYFVYFVETEK